MTPTDYCRDKAAAEGSSLHYSLLYLDAPRQQAIIAIHAFQREINDIVERSADIEPARAKLAWWRMETGALFEQRPDHPITQALAEAMQRFPLKREQLLEVIDGYETDLDRGRYENYEALRHHCDHVSGTISAITGQILGYRNPRTENFARELGLAMHLAAIIRNVGLHARHGRIYLPLDELRRFGVSEDDIFNANLSANSGTDASIATSNQVRQLLAFQTGRARAMFDKALAQLDSEDRKSQRALLALANIHRTVLDEIENDGFRVLDRALSLTPLRKLWIATRSWYWH